MFYVLRFLSLSRYLLNISYLELIYNSANIVYSVCLQYISIVVYYYYVFYYLFAIKLINTVIIAVNTEIGEGYSLTVVVYVG
jgi:hypothetical protein